MDTDSLTTCCLANTKKHQSLSAEKLKKPHELSCGCEEVALEDLLSICECQECGEQYYYSFCRKEILEENHFWHCRECGTCRESAEMSIILFLPINILLFQKANVRDTLLLGSIGILLPREAITGIRCTHPLAKTLGH